MTHAVAMVSSKDAQIFREDARLRGQKLSPADREKLLKPYLPEPEPAGSTYIKKNKKMMKAKSKTKTKPKSKPTPLRTFARSQIHRLIYVFIHLCLGFYIRITQTIAAVTDRIVALRYYHHRSPELIAKDVKGLSRVPEHLSVLLKLRKREEDALQTLMDETAELAAWTTCAGISVLSIYEKTGKTDSPLGRPSSTLLTIDIAGILKNDIPALHKTVSDKLSHYYGSPSHRPNLRIYAPHHSAYAPRLDKAQSQKSSATKRPSLTILLLSQSDGRDTLVDLTKTLTEMSQNGKLSPDDISTKVIDAEISELTSQPSSSSAPTHGLLDKEVGPMLPASFFSAVKSEPDLLIIFGPIVKLDGYPPWQVRLTEIFCTGDKTSSIAAGTDGEAVEYLGFLRALWRYARADFRFGR